LAAQRVPRGRCAAWCYEGLAGGSKGRSCSTVSTKSCVTASIVKSIGLKLTSQWKQRPRLVRGLTTAISSPQREHWKANCPARSLCGHCQLRNGVRSCFLFQTTAFIVTDLRFLEPVTNLVSNMYDGRPHPSIKRTNTRPRQFYYRFSGCHMRAPCAHVLWPRGTFLRPRPIYRSNPG